jgi:hypothetical protein
LSPKGLILPLNVNVLFSNKPLAYREAMATAVQTLRPAVGVTVSDPNELDADISRLRPQLVVCSDLTDAVRADVSSWVRLYPDGDSSVTCSIAGRERNLLGIDLAGLLALVDEAIAHVRAPSGAEGRTSTGVLSTEC